VISFLEKSPEAKEKPTEKKARQETSSSREPDEKVEVEPSSERRDDKDNGSSRGAQRSTHGHSSHHDTWSGSENRDERNMSFEEKLRAFKKQSEERLLHIKRSREAKIGKKKVR